MAKSIIFENNLSADFVVTQMAQRRPTFVHQNYVSPPRLTQVAHITLPVYFYIGFVYTRCDTAQRLTYRSLRV
jgi:hypothetical protein